MKPPWKWLNYQTALSRFQRLTIGSCVALYVIKSITRIRWKYFICIYLFFRLSEYKEIEFIVKCCYAPSLVLFFCFFLECILKGYSLLLLHGAASSVVSVCECEYFTLLSLLLRMSLFLFTPARLYLFTFFL